MPTSQVTVTATATLLADAAQGSQNVKVRVEGANPVYLGDSSAVTTATGYELNTGENVERQLDRGETLYGICGATLSSVVNVWTDLE